MSWLLTVPIIIPFATAVIAFLAKDGTSGRWWSLLGSILLFFALNLHHFVILTIHLSFNHAMTRVGMLNLPTEDLAQALNRMSDYGLLIVAPLLVLLMLVTLVLAFLNKAAPALNLFSVGMSIRVGLGGLLLFMFCPILFGAMEIYFYRVQDHVEQLIGSIIG